MSEELKPCPVCGGEGYPEDAEYIRCLSCSYETRIHASEDEARAYWNSFRPVEDSLQAEIKALYELVSTFWGNDDEEVIEAIFDKLFAIRRKR